MDVVEVTAQLVEAPHNLVGVDSGADHRKAGVDADVAVQACPEDCSIH